MATKATKKPGSLVDMNKNFMSNFSYDRMNPPTPSRSGPLAARPAVPTSQPNTDVVDTFNGLRQQATPQGYRRPVTRRGMSGQELDANGNDPGSGMAWFDKNNSPAQVDARNARQGELDMRRANQMQAAGASAVAERKALQEMGQAPFQLAEANRAANSVKGNDGYMTLFDGKGNAVGTNRPSTTKSFDPGTSSTNPMNPNLQSQIQEGFNRDARQARPKPAAQPAAGNFLDSYATPGGNAAPVVGAPSVPGTPGGGTQEALSFNMPTMQRPPSSFLDEPLPVRRSQLPPDAGPQTQPNPAMMGPRSQPNPGVVGPAPQFTAGQQAALEKLQGMNNFSARVGDLYPGNDWEYLKNLFPQVDTRRYRTPNDLLDAYRSLLR